MRRFMSGSVVVVVGIATFGCSDRPEQSLPTAPPATAKVVGPSCSFNAIGPVVNKYFPTSSERSLVKAILGAMESAGAFTTTAQDSGFSVLAHVAANVDAGNPDSTDASTLANGVLACMYSDPAALPATFPENFLTATDPNASGAFQVRGKAADNLTAGVYNRPYATPFSVVAPPTGSDWSGVLGAIAPQRILVYGRPGSNPYSYDWKVIPRNATFAPQVVVGVCTDAGENATSMLNEQHVGLLPFVLVSDALLPGTCSPQVALRQPSAALRFARRLAHSLFDIQVAWALRAGGIGGTTGGIQSEFNALALFGVNVAFTVQPPTNVTVCATPPCGSGFSTTVHATSTTPSGTFTVGGTTLHLVALNNNGTPTELVQCTGTSCTNDPVATTDNAGNATFTGLFITKTGAAILAVTNGAVDGRAAIPVGTATSRKLNVKPF